MNLHVMAVLVMLLFGAAVVGVMKLPSPCDNAGDGFQHTDAWNEAHGCSITGNFVPVYITIDGERKTIPVNQKPGTRYTDRGI